MLCLRHESWQTHQLCRIGFTMLTLFAAIFVLCVVSLSLFFLAKPEAKSLTLNENHVSSN